MINQYYSPLRYPGGKASLFDFLKTVLSNNNLVDGTYIEGFAGGAGAALKLLMLEEVDKILLNDKDKFIYCFWKSVLYNTDELLKLIRDVKPSLNEWHTRRSLFKEASISSDYSELEMGFTAFFLNRCNRSGILKAGLIGGNNQDGNWKLDARYNSDELSKRISKIALYRDRIKLYNQDCVNFLRGLKTTNELKRSSLLYLDPPYVSQGKELYRLYFKDKDHQRLAAFLLEHSDYNWIVSYDDHPLIHSLFSKMKKNVFEFNYYANKTKVGRELVITSPTCELPETYVHYSKERKLGDYSIYLKQAV